MRAGESCTSKAPATLRAPLLWRRRVLDDHRVPLSMLLVGHLDVRNVAQHELLKIGFEQLHIICGHGPKHSQLCSLILNGPFIESHI